MIVIKSDTVLYHFDIEGLTLNTVVLHMHEIFASGR